MNIVRRFYYLGKTISFTSTPDYLGVLTRSAFAGLAQTIKSRPGRQLYFSLISHSLGALSSKLYSLLKMNLFLPSGSS
jgi:hypothetical protein